MILSKILKKYRELKGWTQEDLSKYSGVSLPTIKRYEAGDDRASLRLLKKICDAFKIDLKDIMEMADNLKDTTNVAWEQTKLKIIDNMKGLEFKNKTALKDKQTHNHNYAIKKENEPNPKKLVKYYPNIKLSAGDGVINYEDEECELIDASFLSFLKLKGLQNIEVVQVQGDSMMPYIEDGEYIILERTMEARNGDIVVFVYENQSYIKQLQTIPNEAKLCFISKNPLYPSFEVRGDEVSKVAIIGVLRAKIRKF